MRGHIGGLGLSNDTDAAHDILVAAGSCVDSTGAQLLILASALSKRIDGGWGVGDGAGGLFSGSVAADTWYHFFLIGKTDGTIDAGFDTSVTAANIPSGYTLYRRIGSVLTDGSANILAFRQQGDEFLWNVPVNDVNTTNPGTAAVSPALTVPESVRVEAILGIRWQNTTPVEATMLFTALDQADTAPTSTLNDFTIANQAQFASGRMRQRTSTSRQIRYRLSASDEATVFRIATHGWIDTRGRDA